MKEIAYFIPDGQHDINRVLGDGWGPRTVYTDGTYDVGDKRIENQIGRLSEQIQELREKVNTLPGAKS